MIYPVVSRAFVLMAPLLYSLFFVPLAVALCIPDVPDYLLSDSTVLRHPAVVAAFVDVKSNLSSQLGGGIRDGFSFAIVHASGPDVVFTFNHGLLKLNESTSNTNNTAEVDSNSVFRVASLSKNIVALSALAVANQSRSQDDIAPLTLDTPLRQLLPEFSLPKKDWENGGSEITLSMLGSESAGLPREGFSTNFNDMTGLARANTEVIGNDWISANTSDVIASIKKRGLIFAPSQRASYSNAGFCLFGYAVANYYNAMANTSLTWSELATQEILQALNMSHSFFGPIPDSLIPSVSVPGSPNWVDIVIGPGYDPAGGMWSSVNDLITYLYNIWLAPSPALITPTQRGTVLQPRLALPDGQQQVGIGWEISVTQARADGASYNVYAKTGDGGAQHGYIGLVPNLGYGIAILSSEGAPASANYTYVDPSDAALAAHEILIPAFREAYSARVAERWAGNYTVAGAAGAGGNGTAAVSGVERRNYARVELEGDVLYLRELVANNVSALLRLDMLSWTPSDQEVLYSTAQGVGLNPSSLEEVDGVGHAFRMAVEDVECDWMDFDGYTDQNGWGLDKVLFVEGPDGMELHYPPLNAVLLRENS